MVEAIQQVAPMQCNGDAHLTRQVRGQEVVVAVRDGRLDDSAEPSGRASGRELIEVFGPWEQILEASRNGWHASLDGRRWQRVLRNCTSLVSSLGEPEGVKAAPEIALLVSSTPGRIGTYDLQVTSSNPVRYSTKRKRHPFGCLQVAGPGFEPGTSGV